MAFHQMTCHSQDLLRSWQLVYELLVKARTQVNVVIDKTTLGPFLYFLLGFGGTCTELCSLEKHLLLPSFVRRRHEQLLSTRLRLFMMSPNFLLS